MASTAVGREKEILSENIQLSKMKTIDSIKQNNTRKTLQTIQFTAVNNNHLVGKENSADSSMKMKQKFDKNEVKVTKIKKTTEPVKVYCDIRQSSPVLDCKETQTVQSLACKETQTETENKKACDDADVEAFNLMAAEEIPMEYWMQIAERRRLALSDALTENKTLHREVIDLKEENEKLHELSGQAEYFAEILKGVLQEEGEEEEKKSEKDDDEEVTKEEEDGVACVEEESNESETVNESKQKLESETVSSVSNEDSCDKEKVSDEESSQEQSNEDSTK